MPLCQAFTLSCALLLVVAPEAGRADEKKKSDKDAAPYLTVRMVDEQGKPVAGAGAGIWIVARSFDDEGDWYFRDGDVADANGIVRFRQGADTFQERPIIIARHAERHSIGIQSFAGKDKTGVVEIVLRPECHVQWRFTRSQVKASGRKLGRINGIANFEGMICFFSLLKGPTPDAPESTFDAVLPPGKYTLESVGSDVKSVSKEIDIKAGQRSLDLGTCDLDAAQFILLEGKMAPELEDIIEWKNGPALKLADHPSNRPRIQLLDPRDVRRGAARRQPSWVSFVHRPEIN